MTTSNLPAFPPGLRRRYFLLSVLLVLVLGACIVAVNTHYLFVAELYESGDTGANSMSVLRAKHFHELFGAYSRWGFHHPGPALFYVFAWGEFLFYDLLGLVPTGYNAQVLAELILQLGFLCGGLCVAARWVRSGLFVPLAILLAVAHWTAVSPLMSLMSCWTAFALPLMLFALLMASASVAAGQGDDLVLLVLAGSFAVHTHVAQPLFVVPLFLVAYAGLTWACRRAAKAARSEEAGAVTAAPWRRFPRAHLFAGIVVFCFLLPMGVDLAIHRDNNFVRILDHMRYGRSAPKPYLDSLYYFLQFAAYTPTNPPHAAIYHGGTTWASLADLLARHVKMCTLWGIALLMPLAAFALGLRGKLVEAGLTEVAATDRRRRRRFLKWLSACWLLSVGLTLYWGHTQDGEMYYYNAWFNYAIWFALAVLGAVAAADLFETFLARSPRGRKVTLGAGLACCVGAAAMFLTHLDRYHDFVYDDEISRNIAISVREAIAARPGAPRVKVLRVTGAGWPAATGIGVLLDRLGYTVQVAPEWGTVFGDDHAPDDIFRWHPWKADGSAPFEIWYVVSAEDDPAAFLKHPLPDRYALVTTKPTIDPSLGSQIIFNGARQNFSAYVGSGWSTPIKDSPYTWSSEKNGLIGFAAQPVPAGTTVQITFDCFPYHPGGKLTPQRFNLNINGDDLGTVQAEDRADQVPHFDVPAAVWNKHPDTVMSITFLDAVSPKEIGESLDERVMAIGTRSISFRAILPHGNPDPSASLRQWPAMNAAGAGAVIRFAGEKPNAADFVSAGWEFDSHPVPYAWSEGRFARFDFRPDPVPGDTAVAVTFDCFPYPAGGKRKQQRASVKMNGQEVGTFTSIVEDDVSAPLTLKIPAALWNQYDTAVLTLDFLDAISPQEAGDSADTRPLALAMRSVTFRVVPAINPVQGAVIRFAGPQPNAADFVSAGWAFDPQPVPYVWSAGPYAKLDFRPDPVPGDTAVAISLDCSAYAGGGKRKQQRALVKMNGQEVGTFTATVNDPSPPAPLKIPAALWNQYDTAVLTLDFLDAISPQEAGDSADTRPLALAMRSITFHVVPAFDAAQH